MRNSDLDQAAIPALADDLRRAWRADDFAEVDLTVEKFALVREQLILDWMAAMFAYHAPDWRPGRKMAFRDIDAAALVSQLDIATFALTTPLAELFQTALSRKSGYGPDAMVLYKGGERVARTALVDQLTECPDLRTQMQCINHWFSKCNLAATQETVTVYDSSPQMRRLVAECAAYRFLTVAIVDRDPSVHLMPRRGPRALAERFSNAAISGGCVVYRLADVLASLAAANDLEITDELVSRNLIENRVLVGMARVDGNDAEALSRIASGCDESCYSTDEAVVRESPHRDHIDLFESVDDFRKRHWRYTWFDPSRFAMFGDDSQAPLMGLAEHLGSSTDPMTAKPVAEAVPRHPRTGCPALAYKGVQDISNIIGSVLKHPVVRDRMALVAQPGRPAKHITGPANQLLAQFDVRRVTDFGEFDRLSCFPGWSTGPVVDVRSADYAQNESTTISEVIE